MFHGLTTKVQAVHSQMILQLSPQAHPTDTRSAHSDETESTWGILTVTDMRMVVHV